MRYNAGNVVKSKVLKMKNGNVCEVLLCKNRYDYTVIVDGDIYYRTNNPIFAEQRYNEV